MIRSSADTAGSHDARLKELIDQSCCRHGDGNGHGYQGLTRYCDECGLNWPRGTNPRKHTTEALMVALRAEQPAWQPIATAPKDGTDVLLLWRERRRVVGHWDKTLECWMATGRNPLTPRLWMPLPDPPQIGSAPDATEAERAQPTRRSAAPKSDVHR